MTGLDLPLGGAPGTHVPPSTGGARNAWIAVGARFLRRVAALLALLVVISFGIYSLQEVAPGSPIDALMGAGGNPSAQQIEALKAKYGLDKPFLDRYVFWLGKAARLDFGDSVQSVQPVRQLLGQRLPVTAELILYAALIAMVGGVGLGVIAALRRGTAVDRGISILGLTGVSIPAFATGLILLYLLSVLVPIFPSSDEGTGFADRIGHLTLPALALSFTTLGYIMRLTRASMIEALGRDYVTFARARGLPRRQVVIGYALRNALIPVMTASALVFTSFLTSTVLVEVTFNITGTGALLVSAITTQDVPVVQGVAMTIAVAVILTNILVEVLYVLADPRLRGGGRT